MWKWKEGWNIYRTLGIWCMPLSQDALPPARNQSHLLVPSAKTINQKKSKKPEIRFSSQQNVLYCLGLCMHNSALAAVVTRSTCWNKEEGPQKKTSYIVKPRQILIPDVRAVVDLKPSAKRGANRTEDLVSLYWSSWNMCRKEPPDRISHKSTKVDTIRSSRAWKKSDQISKSYAISKNW